MVTCQATVGNQMLNPAVVRLESRLRDVSRLSLAVPSAPANWAWGASKLGLPYHIFFSDGPRTSTWEGYITGASSLPQGWRLEGVGVPGVMDVVPNWNWYSTFGSGLAQQVVEKYPAVPHRIVLDEPLSRSTIEVCAGETDFDFLARVLDAMVVDTGSELFIGKHPPATILLTPGDLPFGQPSFNLQVQCLNLEAISRCHDPSQTHTATTAVLPTFSHPFAEQLHQASRRWSQAIPLRAKILGINAFNGDQLEQDLVARSHALLAAAGRVVLRTTRIDVLAGTGIEWGLSPDQKGFVAAGVECQWSEQDFQSLVTCVPRPLSEFYARSLSRPAGPWLTTGIVDVSGEEDPANLQRVRVQLNCHPHAVLWASVLTALAGVTGQADYQPEPGSEVLVAFLEGDLRRPIILGSLHTSQTRAVVSDKAVNLKLGSVEVRIQMVDERDATAGLLITCGGTTLRLDSKGFSLTTGKGTFTLGD